MKIFKILLSMLAVVVVFSGCGNQTVNSTEKENNNTIKNETGNNISSKTTTPTGAPTADYDEREDAPVEYAEANYFTEKVKEIVYYRNGKKIIVSPDTETGKQIILMTKQRYVNTAEKVMRKNKLKKRVLELKKHGKALVIKFVKTCYKIDKGGKSNDYKKVPIYYQSWFYPLEGEDSEYFTPLPNQECTYYRLGSAEQLLDYMEDNIVND